MSIKVLIIEDDSSILRGLKDNLEFEGYTIFTAMEGKEGLRISLEESFDLVLLDLMLPGINGYEICKRVKKEKPLLPIFMITARGTEMDKVIGLDMGADDYLTKPFSMPELLARIRALVRRTAQSLPVKEISEFGQVYINFKKHQALVNGKEISFSTREFEIMQYLIQREGDAIHRHELLDEVWGFDNLPTTRTVDNFMLNLRKKIEIDPRHPKHIISIRGIGYKFEP